MNAKVTIKQITATDTLEAICTQIQPDLWGADNEMTSYQSDSLRRFLESDTNILVLAYIDDKIAGIALAYELPHPDGNDTLYVHELDTHPDFRRQGIAKLVMTKLFEIASDRGLTELWLGADQDNPAANELYKSLSPYEIEPTVTYSYKTDK